MADFSSLMHWPLLFADQQAIRNVMRGLHNRQDSFDSSGLTTALMIFCLFFVTVWGLARLFIKPQGGANQNSAWALFRDLRQRHSLGRRDEWLLMRLARHHRLADPTLVFLDPRWLDPALCGPAWQSHAHRMRELQLTLFAGLATEL
jgi:hypothetical protein